MANLNKSDLEKLVHAIQGLKPGAQFTLNETGSGTNEYKITWNSSGSAPTQSEVDAEIARQDKEYDDGLYKVTRRGQYPAIGDQLDDLYKKGAFSDDMAAKLKKVKDDNPKP